MKKYKSHILAVKTDAAIKAVKSEKGFIPIDSTNLDDFFGVDDIIIASRNDLEVDSYFKHLIPYVLIKHQNKYLVYQRTSKGGEGRLHGNHSIGFGGHIDVGDIMTVDDQGEQISIDGSVRYSADRELWEELQINVEFLSNLKYAGFLYDDSNSVGTVHMGVVIIHEVDSDEIISPEDQIDLKGFMTLEEMKSIDNFENWSQLIIDMLSEE